MNFSIPPKPLDYADLMLPFELLFKDINKIKVPNEDKNLLNFGRINERLVLNNRSNNKNIIIQKSNKSISVVLFEKDKYLEGM